MQCRLFLDVVVQKGEAIFELLARVNKSLLIRWNSYLVIDPAFD